MNTESLIRCLERCSEDKNSCEQCERYKKSVGSMRCVDSLLVEAAETIKSLNADPKESNRIVVQLRKQWQDAEMFICTTCGRFDYKTDGNVVYGNRDCGEIVGWPYCKKFTPWIPTSVRLPEIGGNYFVVVKHKYDFEKEYNYDTDFAEFTFSDGYIDNCWNTYNDWNEGQEYLHITHWMPIPEPPKEDTV